MSENPLFMNEFKEALISIKMNNAEVCIWGIAITRYFPWKKITKLIFVFKANDGTFVTKRDINPFTVSFLKEKLLKVDWGLLYTIKDPIEAYETF